MLIDNDYYLGYKGYSRRILKKDVNSSPKSLRDNGHRITPQRLAIVKVPAKSCGRPSVENIHVQIKKDFPMDFLGICSNCMAETA
jgi:hypothetical protein